jgi:arylsulfatase A-like enzyme
MARLIDSRWCGAILLVVALGAASSCAPEAKQTRPSIVLVVIDTLRADAVSAYGTVERTTPFFDQLADQGVLYERAYAPSPWTLPSHASLLTGLGIDRHGVGVGGRMGLRAEFKTVAERLSDAGYQTVGFSENPLVSDLFGLEQGFQHFSAITIEDIVNEDTNPGSLEFDVVDEVAAFAQDRDPSRPFFMFVNLFDPHSPYGEGLFGKATASPPSSVEGWTADALKASPNRICDRLPSASELEALRALYLEDVAIADAKLEAIVKIARESAGNGDLIVVATADHGEHFGEHRLLDHEFSVRAPVLNIPLVVHGLPDVPPARIDAPVRLVDVSESVLDWAGLENKRAAQGQRLPVRRSEARARTADFLAVYSDEKLTVPETWDETLQPTAETRDLKRSGCQETDRVFGNMVALTRWPFKLIWFDRYPAELYDLSWDPLEKSDLSLLRPEVTNPLIEEAQRRVGEIGLVSAAAEVEPPSDAEIEALRGLGYVE